MNETQETVKVSVDLDFSQFTKEQLESKAQFDQLDKAVLAIVIGELLPKSGNKALDEAKLNKLILDAIVSIVKENSDNAPVLAYANVKADLLSKELDRLIDESLSLLTNRLQSLSLQAL